MNWMISKIPVVGKVWASIGGWMTKLGALAIFLQALSKVFAAAGALAGDLALCKTAECAVTFARGLSENPNMAALDASWTAVGLAVIGLGLRRAIDKKPEAPAA